MASAAAPGSEYAGHALRVFGPPGTGKTNTLARRVVSTVREHGPDALLVASFSVTAAKEIGGRFGDQAVGARPPDSAIGTLHSHAFRSLGTPSVALDPRILTDWNAQVEPDLHITPDTRKSGGNSGSNDGGSGSLGMSPELARTGDQLIGALDKLRAGMTDREDWPANVRAFETRWSRWKRDVGALDFTDMIESALDLAREGVPAPGAPKFIIVDEAQDMTPLEVALALEWGRFAQRLVLGMDDDQAINRWRGGDPAPLLDLWGDGVVDEVLDRSYRVPEAVRAVAERWVRRLSMRREKVYHSRLDEYGDVVPGIAHHVPQNINAPSLVKSITDVTDSGRTVMVIASCNYMLERLIANLRAEGVPFHNPFRPTEQRWNPLGPPTREDAMATAERVRRYLALTDRDWTGADVQAWLELIKLSGSGLHRNAKSAAKHFDLNTPAPPEEVAGLFNNESLMARALEPDIEWLAANLLGAKKEPAAYPIQIAREHGAAALEKQPRVVVGTIHSVKGASADVVYVCPDISAAAAHSMARREGVDEAIRLFYVAMTRAYDELRVLAPLSNQCVKPNELIPPDLEVIG